MESKLRILGQGNTRTPAVSISTSIKKTSVRINRDGDQIDPATKQIIKRNSDEDVVVPGVTKR
jgi:predicted RNA-binding protein with PIN domain